MRLMKRRASGYAVFASQTALWGRRNAHMTRSFTPSVPFPAQDLLSEEEIEKQFNHQAITDQLLAGFNTLHEHHTAAHGDKEGLSRNQSTSEAMRSALGFSLVKRKSTIPDAGFGMRFSHLFATLFYLKRQGYFWMGRYLLVPVFVYILV